MDELSTVADVLHEANTDLLHAILAFVGGGIINTSVLAWLFFRMVSIDRQVAEIKVHLAYIRRELNYTSGRELNEPEGPK